MQFPRCLTTSIRVLSDRHRKVETRGPRPGWELAPVPAPIPVSVPPALGPLCGRHHGLRLATVRVLPGDPSLLLLPPGGPNPNPNPNPYPPHILLGIQESLGNKDLQPRKRWQLPHQLVNYRRLHLDPGERAHLTRQPLYLLLIITKK